MVSPAIRKIAGHEVVEHRSPNRYRPYDRLILRDPERPDDLDSVVVRARGEG